MTLDQWLILKNMTNDAFGDTIGRRGATVSRIRRGLHRPDWATMEAIREVTGGEVMPNDFIDAPSPSEEAA